MLFGKKRAEQTHQEPDKKGAAQQNVGTAALSPEDANRRSMADKQLAAAFGEIVLLLLRSSQNNRHSVADLEWLVVPAVRHGQFAVAEARSKETGAISPVGALLWAMVSDDVDRRLSDMTAPLRLEPNEWRSGDIPWIILATGDTKVLGGLVQQLSKTVFKAKPPKTRIRGKDGKTSVGHLEVKSQVAS